MSNYVFVLDTNKLRLDRFTREQRVIYSLRVKLSEKPLIKLTTPLNLADSAFGF